MTKAKTKQATKAKAKKPKTPPTRRLWKGLSEAQSRAVHALHSGDALDVRAQQLPVGDRDDDFIEQRRHVVDDALREDDPRFDGRAEAAAALDGDLGPIQLPSAADAHRVLHELALLYHQRHAAARVHEKLRASTKEAAQTLASIDARIAERIRVATHRTGLPLFADEEAAGATLD
jgi:hypothetical protein